VAPPRDPFRHRAPGVWQSDHAAFTPAGDMFVSIGYGEVPRRSPYRPGDWVQFHGLAGQPVGDSRHHGWRGYVLGSRGHLLVHGITDDGRPFEEHWAWLVPDGTPDPYRICVCCPHPPRAQRKPTPRVEQLGLFSALDLWGAP